jgi:HEPN domain-containing protein
VQARGKHPDIYLEDLCFDAQQAAEKAIKAVLLHRGIESCYVRDLGELLDLLERAGGELPPLVRSAEQLTDYAVEARCPGLAEPVRRGEYDEVLGLTEAVVRRAEQGVRR